MIVIVTKRGTASKIELHEWEFHLVPGAAISDEKAVLIVFDKSDRNKWDVVEIEENYQELNRQISLQKRYVEFQEKERERIRETMPSKPSDSSEKRVWVMSLATRWHTEITTFEDWVKQSS